MPVTLTIDNCTNCKWHKVISDPDPHDWFCDDDVAVICTHAKAANLNTNYSPSAKWASDRQRSLIITSACRPYNIQKESTIPDQCPLKE